MKRQKPYLLLALMLASPFAEAGDSPFYVGASVGNATIVFDGQDFGSASPSNARERTPIYADTGYQLMLGYVINENWSVEAGYTRQGQFQFRSKNVDSVDSVFDYAASSWFLAPKLALSVTEHLAVFGKLGVTQNTATVHYWVDSSHALALPLVPGTVVSVPNLTASINPGSYSDTTIAPLLGVGIEYAFSKDISVRLEYENYGRFGAETSTGRSTNTMTSLGVTYAF